MPQNTSLTLGNHIYLYRLLSEAIGCGKQTFLTQVEEALEKESLGAADLGFESTRELLEELDDFIKLTVFKGGRIYATVIAQPAWDEALAAPQKKADTSGKSWKKKRGDKSIKAVKPRRVKREILESIETVEKTPVEAAAQAQAETAVLDEATANDADSQAEETTCKQENSDVAEPVEDDTLKINTTEEGEETPTVEEQESDSLPAISLTVIYALTTPTQVSPRSNRTPWRTYPQPSKALTGKVPISHPSRMTRPQTIANLRKPWKRHRSPPLQQNPCRNPSSPRFPRPLPRPRPRRSLSIPQHNTPTIP